MEITIGKYTLETLTSGMYDRPKDIYREYVQNSVDAIDNAVRSGLLTKDKAHVAITVSQSKKEITIADNGIGICIANAERFLLDIGNSSKRYTEGRGFRGIGRLAGLAYCHTLVFETSAVGEDKKTRVVFDAAKLRNQMVSVESELDLQAIMANVVTVEVEQEKKANHYFVVKLLDVDDIDEILDCDKVNIYLSQTAPVNFSNAFKWGSIVKAKMSYLGYGISAYNITLTGDDYSANVYKGYADIVVADRLRKLNDNISEIHIEKFNSDGETLAVLWYAQTCCYGTIQDDAIKGIRMRKGNIQLGNRNTLNHIFKDERFNGWLVGELHIVSNLLIPNARRDELEKNSVYCELVAQLKTWGDNVSAEIRKTSNARNSDKKAQRLIEVAMSEPKTVIENTVVAVQPEISFANQSENMEINHAEIINALDIIIGAQQSSTKYKALNLQSSITIDQKKILEKVFDILCSDYCDTADALITTIIRKFTAKVAMANG